MTLVTVSMAAHRCPRTLPTAVASVLGQTHRDLRLVVINDGETPATFWRPLAGVDDDRLIRFDLPVNRGRYYADAVTLAACTTPWYAVHDADDWSEPQWLAELHETAQRTGAGAVFSPHHLHNGPKTRIEHCHPLLTTSEPIPQLTQLAHHAALYQTAALRQIGGHHPGYRIGYDTLLVDLIRLVVPVAVSPTPRYHRVTRLGSLTTSSQTAFGSPERNRVRNHLRGVYRRIVDNPTIPPGDIVAETVSDQLRADVHQDAARLGEEL